MRQRISFIGYRRVGIADVEYTRQKLEWAGLVVGELSPEQAGLPSDLKMDETILAVGQPQ